MGLLQCLSPLLFPRDFVLLSRLSMCKRLTINMLQKRELDGIGIIMRTLPHLETLVIQLIPPNAMTKVNIARIIFLQHIYSLLIVFLNHFVKRKINNNDNYYNEK